MTTRRSYGDMSEAESERSETSSISLKRTFSQSSMGQSSTRMTPSGAATPATGTLTPADHEADLKAVRVSRSGTWPLRRRKHLHGSVGSNELGSQLDLWEMQVCAWDSSHTSCYWNSSSSGRASPPSPGKALSRPQR
eukprot:scaffold114735_cov34-Tisochrysis_lutea.AAC.2